MARGLQSHPLPDVSRGRGARTTFCLALSCLWAVTSCTSALPGPASATAPGPASATAPGPASATPGPASTATPEPAQERTTAAIPFATIAQQAPLGDEPGDPLYTLVARADGWDDLRQQLPECAIEAASQANLSRDDLVIVAFAGVQDHSGYRVTVENVAWQDDALIVSVVHTAPAPDKVVEPASTLPYHLAAVRGQDLVDSRSFTFTFRDSQGSILGQGTVSRP